MACKRSAVRFRLAPPYIASGIIAGLHKSYIDISFDLSYSYACNCKGIARIIEYDAATNRKYVVIDKDNFHAADYKYDLLASYKDELRFIDEDGVLVRVKGAEPIESPNKLEFYLDMGHTHLKLECESCDNHGPHSLFYDFGESIVGHKEVDPVFYRFGQKDQEFPSPLTIYLNDSQADVVFETISNIAKLEAEGKYKFIPMMRNCVALLTDTYKQSGFPGHFADYHTDSELLHELVEGKSAFIHGHYYPDYAEIIHPYRAEISKFIKSIYGDNYHTYWQFCSDGFHRGIQDNTANCTSLAIPSNGIENTPIDHHKAALNPVISNIVMEVMQSREEAIPKLVEIGLNVWNGYHNYSPALMQHYVDELINAPITYGNLHYSYLLTHYLNMANLFKDEPYAKEVVSIFTEVEDDLLVSDYYEPLAHTTGLLEYYKQCDAGHGEMWGDANQYL